TSHVSDASSAWSASFVSSSRPYTLGSLRSAIASGDTVAHRACASASGISASSSLAGRQRPPRRFLTKISLTCSTKSVEVVSCLSDINPPTCVLILAVPNTCRPPKGVSPLTARAGFRTTRRRRGHPLRRSAPRERLLDRGEVEAQHPPHPQAGQA